MISETMKELNRRGLIPGPDESEEALLERSTYRPPEDLGEPLSAQDWLEAHALLEKLYGIRPDWIPAYYSNKKLRFWEGAAIWIDRVPLIQLRKAFRKGSFCKIYKRKEVLAHEGVHAARYAFSEPRFEELFAYKTSRQGFRRMLGPLFRTPTETLLFLLLLLFSTGGGLFWEPEFFLLPWAFLLLAGARLVLAHHTLSKALVKSRTLLQCPEKALPFLLRLTDREIAMIANTSRKNILHYIERESSLRWQMIRANYLFK